MSYDTSLIKMKIIFLAMMMARLSFAFLPSLSLQQRCKGSRLLLSQQTDGIMNMPEPSPTSAAYSLYHLIHQNRMNNNRNAIPLAGVYDALSAKVFAQNESPALFLSGFGVSASLLGLPDAGSANLVEMEQVARNICSIVRSSPDCQRLSIRDQLYPPPVIVDGDTGYGGASNMLRTISSLGSAGASAISIEDQIFPKKCTIAAGSKIQIVNRDEALERIRGAVGARNLYNERYQSPNSNDSGVAPWIIARTDCRMAYGFEEVVERCLGFESLGAEIIYAENLQSCYEYEQLRARLDPKTVTMIAQVQETNNVKDTINSKPLLTTQEIGEQLGYDLALFGVTPLQCVIGALESCAQELLGSGNGIISTQYPMADFVNVKKIVGFDELQDFESEFPCSSTSTSTTAYADDEDLITFPIIPDDEVEEDKATIEIINGTTEGFIVTKMYKYPLEGIPEDAADDESISLSKLFSSSDIKRLKLEPNNVTLPSALMLLDPEKYPTQSRARKAIRQRSICISRYNQHGTTPNYSELGKVIARIYPSDSIGYQRRSGDDYYAIQGTPYRPPPFNLPVLYEDEYMALVNKPAGVVLYRAEGGRGGGARGGGQGRDTLLSALPYFLKPASNDTNIDDDVPLRRPQPVHRLDRPTSGCLVVAKRKKSLTHLAQQFELRRVKKTYMAIVNGFPEVNETASGWNTIDYELDGKTAITKWRVIKTVKSLHGKGGQLTLVELKPLSGRYHQLRRHMAWVLKCPIVGDSTYDDDDDSAKRLRKRGLFLCSNELVVEHPYYNTPAGYKQWTDMSQTEKSSYGDDAELYTDDDTGLVMVKARIDLPDKFSTFLEREDDRANKFM